MTSGSNSEKPPGAWTAKQCVQYMFSRVRDGEFYIICPDNETSEDLDRLRIRWAADDLVERRPALSRYVSTTLSPSHLFPSSEPLICIYDLIT